MEIITDILLDTAADSLRMLPFLFAAFLLLESLEHHSGSLPGKILTRFSKGGPFFGALLGCIPQCGFSVLAANLYAGGVVSPGTLLSVFLATSDEAVLILMGHPGNGAEICQLLVAKIGIAIIAGYLTDLFLADKITSSKHIGDLCSHCGCHGNHGIIKPALNHTVRLFGYIFLFSGILNALLEIFGLTTVSFFLLNGSLLQPFLAALIGFIPNCAASVILTELYLSGALSFASVIAGLCTNAGLGLIVLYKVNKNRSENLKLTALLYITAAISGILFSL